MLIFLDESGDLGFDFVKKSPSTHFVMTLLVCDNQSSALAFRSAVKHTLKNKINHPKSRNTINELKGTHTIFTVKKYFLTNLLAKKQTLNWRLYTIVLDKRKIKDSIEAIPKPHNLYNVISGALLEKVNFNHIPPYLNKAVRDINLIVDKCKGKYERVIFDNYLKKHLKAILPNKTRFFITHGVSHNNAGLQAVDLFCHGIVRKYTHNDTRWYDLFKDKLISEIELVI